MKHLGFSATAMAAPVPMAQLGAASAQSENSLNGDHASSRCSIGGMAGVQPDQAKWPHAAGIQAQAIWGQSSADRASTPIVNRAIDKK